MADRLLSSPLTLGHNAAPNIVPCFPPTVFIVTTHEGNGTRYAHPIQTAFAHESKYKTSNVLLLEPEKPGHRV